MAAAPRALPPLPFPRLSLRDAFEALPRDENAVQATPRRQATLAADFEGSSLDLPLPASGITGVLMRGKEVLPLARVSLLSADGEEAAHTATDEAGAFFIPYLPPGAYELLEAGHSVRSFLLTEGKQLDLGPVPAP